jgi:CubicO group peptidase (beta-lactamase class C family)
MNNFNKTYSITILLLLFLATACKKAEFESSIKDSELPKNVLPKMKPLIKEPPLDGNFISNTRKKIAHFYNKNWPKNRANGAFLVAKNGQIVFEKYDGLANFNKKDTITASTPLHIASVSKVITAAAVLKLANAKRLSLDQKVKSILKEFPFEDITVRMLLNHRSGLRNYAYFTDRNDGIWDRRNRLKNQDILNILATKNIGVESKANTRFAYCNTNYALLALIIEKITGTSYKDAMAEMIFKPLGMTNTFVFDYEKDKNRIVPSYKANGIEIGKDYLDEVYGDKNIFSTARDLLKFDRARNRKDFLEPELAKQVYVGYSKEKEGEKNYGLGIRMINWKTGQNFYFHNGWWHGNTSSYITLPKEQVTIIALSNKMNKSTYNVKKIAPLFGDYPFETDTEE